ncbi:putative disease resistance protein At3g14460 [Eucalyptus grandis]|uniref:putative disease resistance protein At3g14460 n=1 Tax=Eucalyptus grandis TaxID=71139 RepID=UPI00192EB450|nr:putative disease resistance protein At3g14460 [Eucalyptus grandis]
MAEGLVHRNEGENLWKTGLNYFKELVSRSFFQESSSNSLWFSMHDLLNDLAKSVTGPTHFSSRGFDSESNESNASSAHHASFISSYGIASERFTMYHRMKRLRSFISLPPRPRKFAMLHLSQSVLGDLLSDLKYLRVFSLSHYCINAIPDCVGKLRHLHYLNLSYTEIERLPESIGGLFNLEALILRGCPYLAGLPQRVEKLINLRFLDIRETRSLQTMPRRIGNLVNLEILSKFIVGTENGRRLKELKHLEQLRGELLISDLHRVKDAGDARDANLQMKRGIDRLIMKWSEPLVDSRKAELEMKVVDFLQPHKDLQDLTISHYSGIDFPFWLGNPSHLNMVSLRLCGCRNVGSLPSLGLLSSLKELHIEGLDAVCSVGSEFYETIEPFPSLTTLEFKDMPFWQDWTHVNGAEDTEVPFPCLQYLMVRNCPLLKGRLPEKIDALVRLDIDSCLSASYTSEADTDYAQNLACLKSLDVTSCPQFVSFIAGESDKELPSRLEAMKLSDCSNLEKLPNKMHNLASLRSLIVLNCQNSGPFQRPIRATNTTVHVQWLEDVRIFYCEQLGSLARSLHKLSHLTRLTIFGCAALELEHFPPLPASISEFSLWSCPNVKSLPDKLHHLTSLRSLYIVDCENIKCFPEGGLPPNIETFEVRVCVNMEQHVGEWSLHTLASLQSLWIDGSVGGLGDMVCFPPDSDGNDHDILPSSLTYLNLSDMRNLESLSSGLPCSLQRLYTRGCWKLRCFPKAGLPSSLEHLSIGDCKLLEERCSKHAGDYWHLIKEIPTIYINNDLIS